MTLKSTALLLLLAFLVQAQSQDAEEFDAVSIKPSAPTEDGRGMMTAPGETFTGRNVPFKNYVAWAYNVTLDRAFGPDWIDSARFDIVARAKAAVPPDEMRQMLRNALEKRFHLAAHRETRETPVYALIKGSGEPKRLDLVSPENHPGEYSSKPEIMPDGRVHLVLGNMTLHDFAFILGKLGTLDRPLVDLTGITGTFNFSLDLPTRNDTPPIEYQFSHVFPAVSAQLGLKVEARKAPLEVLVIESASRLPTEN